MKKSLHGSNRLVKHIINNHIVYMIAFLGATTGALVYADQGVPDFESSRHFLQGNLLEVIAGTYQAPKVLSPNGGETYRTGEMMPIFWEGKPSKSQLYLLPQESERDVVVIGKDIHEPFYHWSVPDGLQEGVYAVGLKNGHDLDKSDGFFTIVSKKDIDQNALVTPVQQNPSQFNVVKTLDQLKDSHSGTPLLFANVFETKAILNPEAQRSEGDSFEFKEKKQDHQLELASLNQWQGKGMGMLENNKQIAPEERKPKQDDRGENIHEKYDHEKDKHHSEKGDEK